MVMLFTRPHNLHIKIPNTTLSLGMEHSCLGERQRTHLHFATTCAVPRLSKSNSSCDIEQHRSMPLTHKSMHLRSKETPPLQGATDIAVDPDVRVDLAAASAFDPDVETGGVWQAKVLDIELTHQKPSKQAQFDALCVKGQRPELWCDLPIQL